MILRKKHRGEQATLDFLKVKTKEDLKEWKRKYPEFVFNMEELNFSKAKSRQNRKERGA